MENIGFYLTKPRHLIWLLRNTFVPSLPIPARLPWGGQWLARNDFLGQHVFLAYWFENNEEKFLSKFLRQGMTVIDIGAHQGFYTLLASHRLGKNGRVISFEPSAREFERLTKHLALNGCQNVTTEKLALGKVESTSDLYVSVGDSGSGYNSLRPPAVQDKVEPVQVKITTLDQYLKTKLIAEDKIDLIKVDVEGGELDILQGASNMLNSSRRPFIMCEAEDIRTEPWGYQAKEIIDLLRQHRFKFYKATISGQLKAINDDNDFPQGNVIAAPQERLAELKEYIES